MIKSLKRTFKKGFTLVELIVVIAIVAILAAVSVVSYVAFINSANKSTDEQTVTQVNNALQADEILNGKASTPTEAINVAAEAGFLVEKLTPTSKGYDYAWNSETNRFNILSEDKVVFPSDYGNTANYKLYKFVSTAEKIGSTFSTYLKADFTGTLPNPITKGIDVGDVKNIDTVNYVNNGTKQDVIIRTNGGKLTINAPLDTVEHYGNAFGVNILSVDNTNCYNLHGNVFGNIDVLQGKIVIKDGASVNNINVKATETNKVVINVSDNGEIGSVIAKNGVLDEKSNVSEETVEITDFSGCLLINNNTKTHYETFDLALGNLVNNSKVLFLSNQIITNAYSNTDKSVTFDLNGFELNNTSQNVNVFSVSSTGDTTLENGSVNFKGFSTYRNKTKISIAAGAAFKLNAVTLNSEDTVLFATGDAALVQVDNSIINSDGFCFGTNASTTDNHNVIVKFTNSKFTTSEQYVGTCMYINVPGELTLDNCEVYGYFHGLFARSGTVTIINSKIVNTLDDDSLISYFDDKNWGSGNTVQLGALVLGDKSTTAGYDGNVICKITNSKIIQTGTFGYECKGRQFPALFVWGREKTYVTLDMNNVVVLGEIKINDSHNKVTIQ